MQSCQDIRWHVRKGHLHTDRETREAIPRGLWASTLFVVNHMQDSCVVYDSYGAQSPSSSSVFWRGTLGSVYFFNNALQGLTTNVCSDYCIFYLFFYVRWVKPLDLVFPC